MSLETEITDHMITEDHSLSDQNFESFEEKEILFSPKSIMALLHHDNAKIISRIDRQINVSVRDKCSAWIKFHLLDSEIPDEFFILDLLSNVYKECEEIDENGNILSIYYRYSRFEREIEFEIVPMTDMGNENLQALDFIFGQFTLKEDNKKGEFLVDTHDRKPNFIAKGLEGSGAVIRTALRSGGKYAGDTIRFLGKQYTKVVGPLSSYYDKERVNENLNASNTSELNEENPHELNELNPKSGRPFNQNLIERAQKRKEWAEGFHSGARTVTGAILFPVRWTGKKASEWAAGGSDKYSDIDPFRRAFWDTIAGLGNGTASIFKGFTEALSEMGAAIGDTAMHHSRVCNGEEYANEITKRYVEAASELGLAGYKIANVASFGLHGIVLDAMVEGTTYLVSLYDYLIGPVILQGYMKMVQLPLTDPQLFFVVLRPWSISFYKNAEDFVKKPYKIIATAMLDTIPKLRIRTRNQFENKKNDIPINETIPELNSRPLHKNTTTESQDPMSRNVEMNEEDFDSVFFQPSSRMEMLNSEGLNYVKTENIVEVNSPEELKSYSSFPFHTKSIASESVSQNINENEFDAIYLDDHSIIDLDEAIRQDSTVSSSVEDDDLEYFDAKDDSKIEYAPLVHRSSIKSNRSSSPKRSKLNKLKSYIKKFGGGLDSHIELCTVDCSTYLLYPPNHLIHEWFHELYSSCLRVETIAKRKSGAEEISVLRRLEMFPRSKLLVEIRIKRLVMNAPKSIFSNKSKLEAKATTLEIDQPIEEGQQNPLKDQPIDQAVELVPLSHNEFSTDATINNLKSKQSFPGNQEKDESDDENSAVWHSIEYSSGNIHDAIMDWDYFSDENPTFQPEYVSIKDIMEDSTDLSPKKAIQVDPETSSVITESRLFEEDAVEANEYLVDDEEDDSGNHSRHTNLARGRRKSILERFLSSKVQVSMTPKAYNDVKLVSEQLDTNFSQVMKVSDFVNSLEEEVRSMKIQKQSNHLDDVLELYRKIDPDRLIADWEIFDANDDKTRMDLSPLKMNDKDSENSSSETNIFEFGKKANLLGSSDCRSISIKINKKSNYGVSEFGSGELFLEDISNINVKNISNHDLIIDQIENDTYESKDIWIPIFKKKSNRQIGTLLVNINLKLNK